MKFGSKSLDSLTRQKTISNVLSFDRGENICATYLPHLVKQSKKIQKICTAEYIILSHWYHIVEAI